MPVGGELLFGRTGNFLEPADDTAPCLGPEHATHDRVAVALRQVRPERVSVPVRKISRVVELLQRRQTIVPRCVAYPHHRVRSGWTNRQVFGHAFDEPSRQREHVRLRAFRDVDLERMRDLVPEHVIGLAEAGRERHRNPRLVAFGEAAGTLARRSGRQVGL